MQIETKEYWKLFKPAACNIRLTGQSKEDVFQEVVTTLIKGKALPDELSGPAVEALLAREKVASTGVGGNVAIPHVKMAGLDRPIVSLCVHGEGVEWNALDGDPVHLFFTVLRPESAGDHYDPDRHLDMMRWISVLVRDGDFRRFARRVENRTELVGLLKEMANLKG